MATNMLNIPYPEELLLSLKENPAEFEAEARLLLAVKLYELGRVSTGMAARVAGMSRVAFLFALSRFGLSPVGLEPGELAGDLANAGANWIRIVPLQDPRRADLLLSDLDRGEAEVIALAQELNFDGPASTRWHSAWGCRGRGGINAGGGELEARLSDSEDARLPSVWKASNNSIVAQLADGRTVSVPPAGPGGRHQCLGMLYGVPARRPKRVAHPQRR